MRRAAATLSTPCFFLHKSWFTPFPRVPGCLAAAFPFQCNYHWPLYLFIIAAIKKESAKSLECVNKGNDWLDILLSKRQTELTANNFNRPHLLMCYSAFDSAGADLQTQVEEDPATIICGYATSNIRHDFWVMRGTAVQSPLSYGISFPSVASDFSVRTALPCWLWFSGRLGVMNAGVCSVISLEQSSKVKSDPAFENVAFFFFFFS